MPQEIDPLEKCLMERLGSLKKHKENYKAELFRQFVAARLRKFNPRQYAMTCLKIQQLLVEAQFPPDHEPSHSYSTPTHSYSTLSFDCSAPSQDYYNF